MKRTSHEALAAACLAGLVLAVFGPIWLRGLTPYWGDMTYIHHPWQALGAQLLEKGRLFVGKRSVDLDYGKLGWRKSTEIKPAAKTTWAMILGRLRELAFGEAIRIKEEVNREVLHEWPEERLELVGARRVEKDTFWYEIDEAKLADQAA